jgi:hypothetical protein
MQNSSAVTLQETALGDLSHSALHHSFCNGEYALKKHTVHSNDVTKILKQNYASPTLSSFTQIF